MHPGHAAGVKHISIVRIDGERKYRGLFQTLRGVDPGVAAVHCLHDPVETTRGAVHDAWVGGIHEQRKASPVTAGPMGAAVGGLEEAKKLRVGVDDVGMVGHHRQPGNDAPAETVVDGLNVAPPFVLLSTPPPPLPM